MPNRRLELNGLRFCAGEPPHVSLPLHIGGGAVTFHIRTGRKGHDVFQVGAVFRHGFTQTQIAETAGIVSIINIIHGANNTVMGLVHDSVNRALIGAFTG